MPMEPLFSEFPIRSHLVGGTFWAKRPKTALNHKINILGGETV